MELGDLFRGRLSYRRLWVLLSQLPQESRTHTELRDSADRELAEPVAAGLRKFGPWALTNYQLAGAIDAIRRLEFVTARGGGSTDFPVPEPTPVPGADRPVRRQSVANVTYLNSLRAGG